MLRFVVLCALVAIACSQQNSQNRLECGFSCTRQAQFRVSIDGVPTTATCNAKGADPSERCEGCCRARALAAGLSSVGHGRLGVSFPITQRHCRWIAPDSRRTTDSSASAASSTPADEQTWETLIVLT
ncbi:hypothetical protein Y032_0007g3316 [Ancylostoma ceylanicum]|nr:hypothetical protein Y032_0007g3316 [Ancylostoma ceylanicum]